MTARGLRAIRDTFESLWTERVALDWARDQGAWPVRRFRLERSRVGNSRLLRKVDADRLRGRYGGQVVEVIHHAKVERRLQRKLEELRAEAAAEIGGDL